METVETPKEKYTPESVWQFIQEFGEKTEKVLKNHAKKLKN